jgi:hypothetical protein
MEISFAVNRGDVTAFQDKARYILWSFNPRPRVTPAQNWKVAEERSHGEGWTLYTSGSVPFTTPHVRMGPVMYPIELVQLGIDTNAWSRSFIKSNDPVLFEAPIGSLSVTLSREAIAYDERTIATLKEAIKKYEREIRAAVQAKLNEATTFLQACKIFKDQTASFGPARVDTLRHQVTWRGSIIPSMISSTDEVKFDLLQDGWRAFEKFERLTLHRRA